MGRYLCLQTRDETAARFFRIFSHHMYRRPNALPWNRSTFMMDGLWRYGLQMYRLYGYRCTSCLSSQEWQGQP